MATDPNSIDLDHPEHSGIGSGPIPEVDITIRQLCLSSLLAARRLGTPASTYMPATDAAALLERMQLDSAREHARAVLRTLDAIAEQERPPASLASEVEEQLASELAGRRGWELGGR